MKTQTIATVIAAAALIAACSRPNTEYQPTAAEALIASLPGTTVKETSTSAAGQTPHVLNAWQAARIPLCAGEDYIKRHDSALYQFDHVLPVAARYDAQKAQKLGPNLESALNIEEIRLGQMRDESQYLANPCVRAHYRTQVEIEQLMLNDARAVYHARYPSFHVDPKA